MKRRILSLMLCVVMMLAFAAPALAVTPRSNPENRQYTYGTKTYTAKIALEFNSLDGARSKVESGGPYIPVTLSDVSVTFDTKNYGYVTASGGGRPGVFGKTASVICSYYVSCPYGVSQVLGCIYMAGNAKFYPSGSFDDSTNSFTVYAYTD